MNFLNNTLWESYDWTYATTFSIDSLFGDQNAQHVLVFDGVKMGATVAVNGKVLGNVTDQFLRYVFPLPAGLLAEENNLTVSFDSTINCDGRWMACTGGWDWAPYSQTSQEGAATFSKGIWKSVYIASVPSGGAAISHIIPHTFYKGAYPSSPLKDGDHAGFDVKVRVQLWAPAATSGELAISGSWQEGIPEAGVVDVKLKQGENAFNVTLAASSEQIKLWWPHGVGHQPLYNVRVAFTPSGGNGVIVDQRNVGFRHFAIVTGNDTNPEFVANATGKEGTENLGMLFRVNGFAIFARGANMIPMEELEGRMNAQAHDILVQSAADAGFNVLRVWGGGIFLPSIFYDSCDKLGIMVYHDMQFAQQGHAPKQTPTQEAEFRHQVRRLSHHPSIVIWDGCNECKVDNTGPTSIYAKFLLQVVSEEDRSRSVWPACPAAGWASGVDRLTSRPNGNELVTQYEKTLETHGPYQHGNGWIAANKGVFSETENPIPTNIVQPAATGPQYQNVFASEFGSVVMSSFESMSPTLAEEHWGLHGGAPDERCEAPGPCDGKNAMAERNYVCDNIISKYFGAQAAAPEVLNMTNATMFKRQLYQCMLGQALEMKSNIEARRALNTFGIIVWQVSLAIFLY